MKFKTQWIIGMKKLHLGFIKLYKNLTWKIKWLGLCNFKFIKFWHKVLRYNKVKKDVFIDKIE